MPKSHFSSCWINLLSLETDAWPLGDEVAADVTAKALILGEESVVKWSRLARALVMILGFTRKALVAGIKFFSGALSDGPGDWMGFDRSLEEIRLGLQTAPRE